ncbi:MAG: hypothetical protein ACRDP9_15185 [Kribbellaceae bacterium]
MAKANRANDHIASLRKHVDEFRASDPYTLTPEPTETPERLAYRLRILKEPPVVISATIGDVLHNQRAALENLAFELAKHNHGGQLTPDQEKDTSFPIYQDPGKFDENFAKSKRHTLYGDKAIRAFRSVQPFAILEQAKKHGVALDEPYDDGFRNSSLYRLDRLWNIDKHRRLTVMAWWLDIIYWGSDGDSKRRASRGDGTMAHNSILFYIEGTDEGMGSEVSHKFNLVLKDDPAFFIDGGESTEDVVRLLQGFQQHLSYIFSVVFTAMSQ